MRFYGQARDDRRQKQKWRGNGLQGAKLESERGYYEEAVAFLLQATLT